MTDKQSIVAIITDVRTKNRPFENHLAPTECCWGLVEAKIGLQPDEHATRSSYTRTHNTYILYDNAALSAGSIEYSSYMQSKLPALA